MEKSVDAVFFSPQIFYMLLKNEVNLSVVSFIASVVLLLIFNHLYSYQLEWPISGSCLSAF